MLSIEASREAPEMPTNTRNRAFGYMAMDAKN
jgi:hypothetical protein